MLLVGSVSGSRAAAVCPRRAARARDAPPRAGGRGRSSTRRNVAHRARVLPEGSVRATGRARPRTRPGLAHARAGRGRGLGSGSL